MAKGVKLKGDFLMIPPHSLFKKIWTITMLILLAYTATVMPYRIALVDDDNFLFMVVDTIVDFLFMFDIFVNINTPV